MDLKMTENKIALEKQREILYKEVDKAYKLMRLFDKVLQRHRQRYYKLKIEYEGVDHRLAMIDGRYRTIERGRSSKVPNAEEIILRLNKAQILRIAAELGVEIEGGGSNV